MTDTAHERESGGGEPDKRRLVIVTGAGRSGTSTVAGSLTYLGYVVPPPELAANEANPRGYFEPRWVINFHKRLLDKASVHTMDTRPWAPDLISRVTKGGGFQRQLTGWLERAFDNGPHLVVKDPRALWARALWLEAAKTVGADTSFLTMLRHPAEVIGSRDTHYSGRQSEERRAAGLVKNVAGWINTTLLNEQLSRGERRVFLRYGDLLEDWRGAMSWVDTTLALGIDERQFSRRTRHQIDDFIDPGLRRVRVTWADMRLPSDLQELAEQVWGTLASTGPEGLDADAGVLQTLDTAHTDYRRMFSDAVALAGDEINSRTRQARNQARRAALEEAQQVQQERERELPPPAVARESTQRGQPRPRPVGAARFPRRFVPVLRRAGGRVTGSWRRRRWTR